MTSEENSVIPFGIHEEVKRWFSPEALLRTNGSGNSITERAGREWLAMDGKRWRPLLTVLVARALAPVALDRLVSVAVGVECFHKASLVHDDIEDADAERYGHPTVHARYGIPLAINVGDWLIGEGYRLLDESPFSPEIRSELARAASRGHCKLCLGQGNELQASAAREPLPVDEVLLMYEQKTSSAFEVAVLAGAIVAEAGPRVREILSEFARLIGIAYQIQDDCEDFSATRGRTSDLLSLRPTICLAEAMADADLRETVLRTCREPTDGNRRALMDAVQASGVRDRVMARLGRTLEELQRLTESLPQGRLSVLLKGIADLAVRRK